jgi:hypothetical protein
MGQGAMTQDFDLERQLEHEQRLAARYRFYVSVVMVAPTQAGVSVRQLLDESLRECDEIFVLDEGLAILMPHTTLQDANRAVDRFKAFCAERIDLRFSIATYPTDDAAPGLLNLARERLAEAKSGEFGEVVMTG